MSCLVVGRERKEKKEKAQEVKADRIVKAQARKRSAASEACASDFCSLLVASKLFTKETDPIRWLLVTLPSHTSPYTKVCHLVAIKMHNSF
jgi:hypothetical protein